MKKISHVARLLKRARLEKGVSQNGLARILKITSCQFISNWENGRAYPPRDTAVFICNYFGIPKEQLIRAAVKDEKKRFEALYEDTNSDAPPVRAKKAS